MRTITAALIMLASVTLSVSAIELGIAATSESVATGTLGTALTFEQTARGGLSLQAGSANGVLARMRGGYQYALGDDAPLDWNNFWFDELFVSFDLPVSATSRFSATLGRFVLSDLTEYVYQDQLDGAQMQFEGERITVSAFGGYTGFLFDHDNTVLMSAADTLVRSDSEPFGPPRAVAQLLGRSLFPNLGMSLSVAILLQFDFHDSTGLAQAGDTTLSSGGPVSTQYQTIELAGPLTESLTYVAGATVNSGQTLYYDGGEYVSAPVRALLAYGSLEYSPAAALEPVIRLAVLYASGDGDASSVLEGNTGGAATAFVPISNRSLSFVEDPYLSNLIRVALRGSLLPLGSVQDANIAEALSLSASATTYLQPTTGVSSFADAGSSYSGTYLGTEAGLQVSVVPASFLRLDVEGAFFFPAATAFGSSDPRYRTVGTVHITF